MPTKYLKEILPLFLLIIIIVIGAGIFSAPCSPERFPMHWNISGEIDGWASRTFTALFVPILALSCYLMLLFLPFLDPLKKNYSSFDWGYYFTRVWLLAFFLELYIITLLAGFGFDINVAPYIIASMALFFVGLGWALPTVKRNYFFGIKTPWTLQSDAVWLKTHRLAGRVFVVMGFLSLAAIFMGGFGFVFFLIVIFAGVIIPIVYSYVVYRRSQQKASNN